MSGCRQSGRGLSYVVLASLAIAAMAHPARAQLSSAASTATGTVCNAGNNADRSCTFGAGLTVNTATTITARHTWNVNADIGILSTSDMSSDAQHNVTFNATAVGGYRLDITTNRSGDMNRVNDASGCDGASDTSAIAGVSNIALNSGSLNLADPGSIGNGGSTTSVPFDQSSSATIFRQSNGVAQGHTLTFTWTGSVRSNSCEAAVRQGAQNGTTTGCSACVYPGSPSRTQDDDGHFVTVTFTSLCGNSIVDSAAGEQCDLGASNGAASSCCTSACQFRLIGTTCRAAAGDCDLAETCSGLSGLCPSDAKKPNGTGCRLSAGQCDIEEVCNGVSNTCPSNAFRANTVVCRAGSAGEVCDITEFCTGSSANCPADAVQPNGTLCRANTGGGCDVAEFCNGSAKFCPVDGFQNIGTVCRASAGACDQAEGCSGAGPNCPANQFQPNIIICRASAGDCDIQETCTGGNANCPADAKSTAVCRAAVGACDLAETCDGSSNTCAPDAKSTAECRAAAGACDVAEVCGGIFNDCPPDVFAADTVECRGAAGDCDVAETCDGDGADCPTDTKATTECRASAGGCDAAELCDGSGNDCPVDAFSPSGTTCRASAGACDVAESCDGLAIDCPADVFQPSGTACPDGLFCNGDETCNGSGGCLDGADPCPIVCSEGLDLCLASGCPPAPLGSCRTALSSKLLIKNKEPEDNKDKLIWKWIKGQSTSQDDFADPTATANYALCIYSGGSNVAQVDVPPDDIRWAPIGTKGYKYLNVSATEDGAQKITLAGSSSNKTKVLFKGRGTNLPDPIDVAAMTMPVTVQLINHETGVCFASNFTSAPKNTTSLFKAKTP